MNKTIPTIAAIVSLAWTVFAQSPGQRDEGIHMTYDRTNNIHILSWWGRAGQSYFIQHSEDLQLWSYYPTIVVGQETVASMSLQTGTPNYFLRLEVEADPFNTDSDMDGIPDGWEVLYGLNPHDPNDAFAMAPGGLTYLEKYQKGLNPLVADTDGDGVVDSLDMFPNDARRTDYVPAKFYAVTDLSSYLPDNVKATFNATQVALDDNHHVAFFGTSDALTGSGQTGHVCLWQDGTFTEPRTFPMEVSFERWEPPYSSGGHTFTPVTYIRCGLAVNGINSLGTLAAVTGIHYTGGAFNENQDFILFGESDAGFVFPWPPTSEPTPPSYAPAPAPPDQGGYNGILAVNNAGDILGWDNQWKPDTGDNAPGYYRDRTLFNGQEIPVLSEGSVIFYSIGYLNYSGLNNRGTFLVRGWVDDPARPGGVKLADKYCEANMVHDAPDDILQINGTSGAHQSIGATYDNTTGKWTSWFAVETSTGVWSAPFPLLDLLKWNNKPTGTRDDWEKYHSALRNIRAKLMTDADPATAGAVIAGRTYPNGVPSTIMFAADFADDDPSGAGANNTWTPGRFVLEFDKSAPNPGDWHYHLAEQALPAGVSLDVSTMNFNGTLVGIGDIQPPATPGNANAAPAAAGRALAASLVDFKPRKWVVTEPNTNPADLLIGFDPPIAGDRTPTASDKDVPEWWASITTIGSLNKNEKLRVTLGPHTAGISYKLVVTGDLAGKFTVSPATVTADSTDITLQATAAAAGMTEPLTGKVEVRHVKPGTQDQKLAGPALSVQMFPPLTVNVGIYFVDDPNTAKDNVPLPRPVTAAGIIAALNKTYAACGIIFQTQASQTYPPDSVLPWPYDADNDGQLSFIGGAPESDSIYHFENALPAKLNIILAKNLLYRPPISGITEIWANQEETQLKHKLLFAAWDGRSADSIQKTCVHEIGHALRISKRNGYDPTYLGGRTMSGSTYHGHDLGVFPNDALRELSGNPQLRMFGIMYREANAEREFWLRHEDWKPAWDTVNQKFK